MGRMRERLDLLKAEVEGRGNVWIEDGEGKQEKAVNRMNGTAPEEVTSNGDIAIDGVAGQAQSQPAQSGRLTDGELRAMLRARMEDSAAEDEEGVYL